jgi:type I restriction enzyme S subunit
MKEGWTYKKLGEVCESLNGLWKGKKPPYMNVGVIRNANFTKDFTLNFDNIEYLDVEEKQYSKRKLRAGDIIVEKSGGSDKQPVGRAVLFDKSEGEYSFSNFTSVLRIKDQNEIYSAFLYKYLLYVYLGGATKKMQKATTGIHNLEFQQYLNIDVPCIEMGVQQRIVERLDAAFENIEKLKANAEKQLAEAQTLFQKSLAKAMKPKEGWEERLLSEIVHPNCSLSYGIVQPGDHVENGIPVVRPVDFNNQLYVKMDGLKRTKPEISDAYQRTILKGGEILLCVRGTTGTMGIASDELIGCNVTRGIVPIYFDVDVCTKFVYYELLSPSLQDEIAHKTTGAALKQINIKDLRNLHMSIPPLAEQQRIVERLDALSENIRKYEEIQRQIISECDALKQALLRKVFE